MNTWNERSMLEMEVLTRTRNTDSSVSAQYEDSVPMEPEWEPEDEAS